MFAIGTFFFSLLAISALFLFKHWEVRSGKKVSAEWRSRADLFVTEQIEHAPRLHESTLETGKHLSRRVLVSSFHYLAVFSLSVVRFLERRLVNVINMIKGKNKVENKGNASSFLMKVSEHKKVNGKNNSHVKENVQ